jgi:hypothetical protein
MKIFYKSLKIIVSTILLGILLTSCKDGKLIGGDARKFPDDPKLRVKKNLEEGRGFRLSDSTKILGGGGTFDFASSNELWRASLDVIDFMPLTSVNYSGGIIITDWYSSTDNPNESIKVSIRFLTNEIRSDALDIKVFNRKCIDMNLLNCKVIRTDGVISSELKKEILKKAAIYEKNKKDKND